MLALHLWPVLSGRVYRQVSVVVVATGVGHLVWELA